MICFAPPRKRGLQILERGFGKYSSKLVHSIKSVPKRNVTLIAYLQSWKYFHKYSDEIRFLLQPRSSCIDKANRQLMRIRSKFYKNLSLKNLSKMEPVFVGLQVRRGDKLTQPRILNGHRVANTTYISRAMHYFRHQYASAVFVVCSDDISWCKRHIRGPDVYFPSGVHSAIHDITLLTLCNVTIITVGTFGWWAAYLAGGDAVYFRGQFAPGSRLDRGVNNEDFYLPTWTGMDW